MRMWMEPKARAPGAPQRYTNVTAMKHSSSAHDYPRSRTSNGSGTQQTRVGALYFADPRSNPPLDERLRHYIALGRAKAATIGKIDS